MAEQEALIHAPGGSYSEQNHHSLGDDGVAHLDSEGRIFKMVNGQMVELQADGQPISEEKSAAETSAATGPGWVTYASWPPSEAIETLSGTWSVPEAPSDIKKQIIFLHIGLKGNSSGEVVFAPIVLQWGKTPFGGGLFWSTACWLQVGEKIMVGNYVRVEPGMKIEAKLTHSVSGGRDLWAMLAKSESGNAVLTFTLDNPLTDPLAYGGVLEAYALNMRCDQYPASPSLHFQELTATGANGPLVPQWQATSVVDDCGQATNILSPSEVEILFRGTGS